MKIKGYIAAALVLLCLCGCSDKSASTSDAESVAPAETTVSETVAPVDAASEADVSSDSSLKSVYDQITLSVELPNMIELNDNLVTRYYGLSTDIVADYAGGVDAGGVGQDEIVLMKAADESKVSQIEEALWTRYNSKYSQQENYNPEEAEKIKKCKVETKGLYVTLIISNDADAINEIVNAALS